MNKFPKSLDNSALKEIMIRTTIEKVENRIRYFGESYKTAKANVKNITCAGPAVWAEIDRKFNEVE